MPFLIQKPEYKSLRIELFAIAGIVLAQYEDTTDRICHYNDLLWEFKTNFKSDLKLIYTEPHLIYGFHYLLNTLKSCRKT